MSPRFFYYSQEHEEALVRMLLTVTDSKGLMALTGESGVGKTYVARLFAAEMRDKGCRVGMVVNPKLTPPQLLQETLYQFGITEPADDKVAMLHGLHEHLAGLPAGGSQAVLIIDEAQLITEPAVFEEIRLLLNLENDERPLLTILLIGQPELWTQLRALPPLMQRIGVAYQLQPFTATETANYVRHRLAVAGARHDIFTDDACQEVHRYTHGVARDINTLCDMALLIGSGTERDHVDKSVVLAAIQEIRSGAENVAGPTPLATGGHLPTLPESSATERS